MLLNYFTNQISVGGQPNVLLHFQVQTTETD